MASGSKPLKVCGVVAVAMGSTSVRRRACMVTTNAREGNRPAKRSVRQRTPLDRAGPARDLGSPRRPELGEDVLDVAARGLRRDPERIGDLGVGVALGHE